MWKEAEATDEPISLLEGFDEGEIDTLLAEAAASGKLDDAALQRLRPGLLVLAAREDTPEGYKAFYELVFGTPPPRHSVDWIHSVYRARAEDKGAIIQAFRGSTKTTTLTIGFTAFRIGHDPQKAYLLIQVGDDIAEDNTSAVANIIENNPAWKAIFPDIIPDKETGWGARGYHVRDQGMSKGAWASYTSKRKDPTLLGVGYRSDAIIGKHPDGMLIVDDINNETNTDSARELDKVMRILTGTIFPVMVEGTWNIFVGTPWVEDDVLEYVRKTGEFYEVKTPIFEPVLSKDNADYMYENQPVKLTWPEQKTGKLVSKYRVLSGMKEFARMYLLDLALADVDGLPFQLYPHEYTDLNWPMWIGVDYASVLKEAHKLSKDRSYFAMAYVLERPTGGGVLYGGFVGRVTQAQAEMRMVQAQAMFPNVQGIIFEGDGKGEEALHTFLRNPNLNIIPMKTGGRGKKERLERQMSPYLESGVIRISDEDTDFLRFTKRALRKFPNYHLDTLDALYWALRGMPHMLVADVEHEELPPPNSLFAKFLGLDRKKKKRNPYALLGR